MSIANTESGDADRRAILKFVQQMMGPMYDPMKEDQYVRAIRIVREYKPIMSPPEFLSLDGPRFRLDMSMTMFPRSSILEKSIELE